MGPSGPGKRITSLRSLSTQSDSPLAGALAPAKAAREKWGGPAPPTASDETTARREPPIAAFAYAAQGSAAKSIGVQAYGLGLVAPGQDRVLGGGGAIWGSPVRRLTLV